MTILADFEAEHREIENAVSLFLALLAEAVPPDTHRLMSARWRLTFLISRHVSVEDTHLYPIIAADMRVEVTDIIDRFTGQIGIFRQKFRAWQDAGENGMTGLKISAMQPEALELMADLAGTRETLPR